MMVQVLSRDRLESHQKPCLVFYSIGRNLPICRSTIADNKEHDPLLKSLSHLKTHKASYIT